MGEEMECPEHDCTLRLGDAELIAHLEWDHRYSKRQAVETVSELSS